MDILDKLKQLQDKVDFGGLKFPIVSEDYEEGTFDALDAVSDEIAKIIFELVKENRNE